VAKDLVINASLAELILGYSRGSNSRPFSTDHVCMLFEDYIWVWTGLV
jgi:hypothetical protein